MSVLFPRQRVRTVVALASATLIAAAFGWPLIAQQEGESGPPPVETEGQEQTQEDDPQRAPLDPDDLPEMSDVTTSEQDEALQLVEQILNEQRLILAGQNFVYRSDGRRDPFRSLLLRRQRELAAPEHRPPGLAGFMVGEVGVQATARFQGRWHALVIGMDRQSYFAEVGAALLDGRIVEISAESVVFEQEVQDLMGARSTRQVIKRLNDDTEE